jgi:hypothetical protein
VLKTDCDIWWYRFYKCTLPCNITVNIHQNIPAYRVLIYRQKDKINSMPHCMFSDWVIEKHATSTKQLPPKYSDLQGSVLRTVEKRGKKNCKPFYIYGHWKFYWSLGRPLSKWLRILVYTNVSEKSQSVDIKHH